MTKDQKISFKTQLWSFLNHLLVWISVLLWIFRDSQPKQWQFNRHLRGRAVQHQPRSPTRAVTVPAWHLRRYRAGRSRLPIILKGVSLHSRSPWRLSGPDFVLSLPLYSKVIHRSHGRERRTDFLCNIEFVRTSHYSPYRDATMGFSRICLLRFTFSEVCN